MTTPRSNRPLNSRARIIASAMSVTVQLVEAEQARAGRDLGRNERNRVAVGRRAAARDAVVNFGHELVKVHAALLRDVGRLVEEVHQHRLAAPDGAMKIDPARRRARGPAEDGEKAGPHRAPPCELFGKLIQPQGRTPLSLVRLDFPETDQLVVLAGNAPPHRPPLVLRSKAIFPARRRPAPRLNATASSGAPKSDLGA